MQEVINFLHPHLYSHLQFIPSWQWTQQSFNSLQAELAKWYLPKAALEEECVYVSKASLWYEESEQTEKVHGIKDSSLVNKKPGSP